MAEVAFGNDDQLLEALKTFSLHLAIKSGYTRVAEYLISNNANIETSQIWVKYGPETKRTQNKSQFTDNA